MSKLIMMQHRNKPRQQSDLNSDPQQSPQTPPEKQQIELKVGKKILVRSKPKPQLQNLSDHIIETESQNHMSVSEKRAPKVSELKIPPRDKKQTAFISFMASEHDSEDLKTPYLNSSTPINAGFLETFSKKQMGESVEFGRAERERNLARTMSKPIEPVAIETPTSKGIESVVRQNSMRTEFESATRRPKLAKYPTEVSSDQGDFFSEYDLSKDSSSQGPKLTTAKNKQIKLSILQGRDSSSIQSPHNPQPFTTKSGQQSSFRPQFFRSNTANHPDPQQKDLIRNYLTISNQYNNKNNNNNNSKNNPYSQNDYDIQDQLVPDTDQEEDGVSLSRQVLRKVPMLPMGNQLTEVMNSSHEVSDGSNGEQYVVDGGISYDRYDINNTNYYINNNNKTKHHRQYYQPLNQYPQPQQQPHPHFQPPYQPLQPHQQYHHQQQPQQQQQHTTPSYGYRSYIQHQNRQLQIQRQHMNYYSDEANKLLCKVDTYEFSSKHVQAAVDKHYAPLRYMFEELIELFAIGEVIKYQLKYRSYEILTKIFAEASAYYQQPIRLEQPIKAYTFSLALKAILNEYQKSELDIVVTRIFQQSHVLSYEDFFLQFGSVVNSKQVAVLEPESMKKEIDKTLQKVKRLFVIWIETEYYTKKVKQILRNSKVVYNSIMSECSSIEDPMYFDIELLEKFFLQGQRKNPIKKIKLDLYFRTLLGNELPKSQWTQWIHRDQMRLYNRYESKLMYEKKHAVTRVGGGRGQQQTGKKSREMTQRSINSVKKGENLRIKLEENSFFRTPGGVVGVGNNSRKKVC